MKRIGLTNILVFLGLMLLYIGSQAGIPLWEFQPLTLTQHSIPKNGSALVSYLITHQSTKPHTLVLENKEGIQQITGPGLCNNPFILSSKGSACILSLQINGSQLTHPISDGPLVCQQGSHLQCYRPNPADILKINLVDNQYSIGGVITGLTGQLVLLNNSSDPLTWSTDGQYTFTQLLKDTEYYLVTIQNQPSPQICTVSNASGVIQANNVSNVNVVCSTNAYTVGGNVTGLSGTIVLQINNSETLSRTSDSSFTFPTPVAQGSPYSVSVQSQPVGQTCSVLNGSGTMGGSNVTDIIVSCTMNTTQLSIPSTATIPASLSAITNSITVTNIGSHYAYNVAATLPSEWTAVDQNSSDCAILAPINSQYSNTCTITFSSSQAYIAQNNIEVTGTNVINPPNMAIAFTVQGYLVWDVTFGSVKVIDLIDMPPALQQWGGYSTSINLGPEKYTDGKDNTQAIVLALGAGTYAAQSCYNKASGGAVTHPWYLPALCQMGEGSNCPSDFANINTNLAQLGFGGLGSNFYWTSTESSSSPDLNAWRQTFDMSSTQDFVAKFNSYAVRCAREMTVS